MPVLVQIKWVANPFRGDTFAEGWRPAAEAVMDYGAHSWAFYRAQDGRLDFVQEVTVGGWLAVTVQLRARDQGLPLPAAALLISPCVDMETTGASYEANRDSDPFF